MPNSLCVKAQIQLLSVRKQKHKLHFAQLLRPLLTFVLNFQCQTGFILSDKTTQKDANKRESYDNYNRSLPEWFKQIHSAEIKTHQWSAVSSRKALLLLIAKTSGLTGILWNKRPCAWKNEDETALITGCTALDVTPKLICDRPSPLSSPPSFKATPNYHSWHRKNCSACHAWLLENQLQSFRWWRSGYGNLPVVSEFKSGG